MFINLFTYFLLLFIFTILAMKIGLDLNKEYKTTR